MSDTAPDGLPIYELGDPEAPYGLAAMGGDYVIVTEGPIEPGPGSEKLQDAAKKALGITNSMDEDA